VRGTLVTKQVTVNRATSVKMYNDNLLPALMEKWPAWEPKVVKKQLENAPAHPQKNKEPCPILDAHLAELRERGWDFELVYQPPNSPDCNITLDLAIFCAILSIQYEQVSNNIEELIANVMEAIEDLPLDVCKRVWSTAQIVMNSILLVDVNGGNNYALPHVSKLKLARLLGQDLYR
jgi:hypothetical protein